MKKQKSKAKAVPKRKSVVQKAVTKVKKKAKAVSRSIADALSPPESTDDRRT